MLKRILIASAMLLSIAPAQADEDYPDLDFSTYENMVFCVDKFCFSNDGMAETTPAEREQLAHLQAQMGHLKARVDRVLADARERTEAKQTREKAEAELEAKKEAARRQQCVVPIFWIGCPEHTN